LLLLPIGCEEELSAGTLGRLFFDPIQLVFDSVSWDIRSKQKKFFQEISEHGIFHGISYKTNRNRLKNELPRSKLRGIWCHHQSDS